jgi:hypothetical protein
VIPVTTIIVPEESDICPPDALLVDLEKELLQIDATIRYINQIDVIVSIF